MNNKSNFQLIITGKERKNNKIDPAFVGILPSNNEKPFFVFPYGFEEVEITDKLFTDIFFLIYRIFSKYKQDLEAHKKLNSESGIEKSNNGQYKIPSKDNDGIAIKFYSELNGIDEIINSVEGEIFFEIKNKIGLTHPFEIKSKHLEYSIYQNGIAIIDEVPDNKKYIASTSYIDIVLMLSYLYEEIQKASYVNKSKTHTEHYAKLFREKFEIKKSESIFYEKNDLHLKKLRHILESIHLQTVYKDPLYLDIYNAIYTFLYFKKTILKNKIIWGIESFAFIWEEMCLHFLLQKRKENILYADTQDYPDESLKIRTISNQAPTYYFSKDKDEDKYPFFIQIPGYKKIYIFPDVVLQSTSNRSISFEDFFEVVNHSHGLNNNYKIYIKQKYKSNKLLLELMDSKEIVEHGVGLTNETINELNAKHGIYNNRIYSTKSNITTKLNFFKNEFIKMLSRGLMDNSYIELFPLDTIKILDFKYYTDEYAHKKDNENVKKDQIKQLAYELAFKNSNYLYNEINSYFILPKYLNVPNQKMFSFLSSQIQVQYWNFQYISEFYIKSKK